MQLNSICSHLTSSSALPSQQTYNQSDRNHLHQQNHLLTFPLGHSIHNKMPLLSGTSLLRWSGRTRGKFHRHETVASRREIGDIDKNNKFNGQLPVVVITSHHSFRSWKWDQFLILPCFPQSLFYRTHATRKSVCERKLEIFWRLPLTIHQAAAVPCRNQIIGIPHHSAMSQSRWLLKVADAIKWF